MVFARFFISFPLEIALKEGLQEVLQLFLDYLSTPRL